MATVRSIPSHKITHNAAYLEEKTELKLTEQSHRAFESAQPGQGLIGLTNVRTGETHLIISFNKNDGLARVDKSGRPYASSDRSRLFCESIEALGKGTGDLHTQAVAKLGLGEIGGSNGLLMGFGIWKSGACLKILSDSPPDSALIPNEYLLIKEKGKGWSLIYVTKERNQTDIPIDKYPGLKEILASKDVETISLADRKKIESMILLPAKEEKK